MYWAKATVRREEKHLSFGIWCALYERFGSNNATLTHLPLVPHICISETGQHWFRWWLAAYSAPSHYLNQYWIIVNWTLRNKLQWNFNKKTKLFIHENASENIICKKVAILSRGRCDNSLKPDDVCVWNGSHSKGLLPVQHQVLLEPMFTYY